MLSTNFQKYNNYLLLPDLSNKLLITTKHNIISPTHFTIHLKYVLSSLNGISFAGIKTLLTLETIYPIKAHLHTKMIVLKYSKPRKSSVVFLTLNGFQAFNTLRYFILLPASYTTTMQTWMQESKYFSFPGITTKIQFPSWSRHVHLSFEHHTSKLSYFFFLYKTALLIL